MDILTIRRICSRLHHYGVSLSLLLAGGMIVLDWLLCLWNAKTSPAAIASFISAMIHLICLIVWACGSILYTLSVIYADKTGGRSFLRDRLDYSRNYKELLDFFAAADPYRMDLSDCPVEDWHQAEGVILGKVGDRLIKRPSRGVGNLAVFSLPGGGKTTSQIIPSALRFSGSILAVDIKGDILAYTQGKRDIKVFAPESPSHSAHFNALEGIAALSMIDRKTAIEQIAYILLPDGQDKDGKYFVEGGRDYFCGIALYMLDASSKTTLPDIARAIVTGNAFEWATKVAEGPCDIAKSYLASYIGTNEKNVAGAYGTIVKAIRPFAFGSLADLLDGSGDCITPGTLEAGFDVYIEIPQDKIKIYAPVTTLIVQQFMTAFMRRADRATGHELRPILFLLDEFPQLAFDYDTLSAALSTLRSKGVSLFLAMQSISQLTQRYGEAGFRSIIDTCAYISIMSAQDPESREFFSKLCGTRRTLKISTSSGENTAGRSTQEEREPVYQPADFGNLGDDVIIVANGKYIRAQKTYCYK